MYFFWVFFIHCELTFCSRIMPMPIMRRARRKRMQVLDVQVLTPVFGVHAEKVFAHQARFHDESFDQKPVKSQQSETLSQPHCKLLQ